MSRSIEFKTITEASLMYDVEELQRNVWGNNNITPTPQLIASISNGGVVIGAYDQSNLIGFCYGFPGFKDGEVTMCSHMMAIDPAYRDLGIGYQLKQQQRVWASDYGYQKITWTFDPLETRNAFLNLCKLGGIIRTYIPSYYGEMNDEVNKGLPTDRFLLEWDVAASRVLQASEGTILEKEEWKYYPSLMEWSRLGNYAKCSKNNELKAEPGYLVPVPLHLHEMKKEQPEVIREWRFALRDQFQHALSKGYLVTGLLRSTDPVHYYVIEKSNP
ncbi:GNAT family N-acetyltransferase [Brevibacillus daliensis]|uniref:GNAT family N-acetyltransferase n=1 Tax=Brevibacillus daliensis TaxID=2892995 RepID=UPI001E484B1B|nr:GNAT family N-acetyltransferase [Brevibacillus daliensis]